MKLSKILIYIFYYFKIPKHTKPRAAFYKMNFCRIARLLTPHPCRIMAGMTEEKPPPPRTSRPANVNRPPEITVRAPKRMKMPVSMESRFIGYLVLGFGVLAVIAVAILALNAGDDAPASAVVAPVSAPSTAVAPTKTSSQVAQDMATELRDKPITVPVKKIERKDLYFKRQPEISATAVEGSWQSQIGNRTAVLKMSGGSYQISIGTTEQPNMRIYSSGTYKKTEDIFVFTPQEQWSPPTVPKDQTLYYKPLTRAPFPVIAAIDGGKMLWQNPPPQETRVDVPYSMVLLTPHDTPYVVWQKM